MSRHTVLVAAISILCLAASNSPAPTTGSFKVDAEHSDAQLITDATTDYGKTKLNVTLGFARMNGRVEISKDDLNKSSFDFSLFPSTSVTPVMSVAPKGNSHKSHLQTDLPAPSQIRFVACTSSSPVYADNIVFANGSFLFLNGWNQPAGKSHCSHVGALHMGHDRSGTRADRFR